MGIIVVPLEIRYPLDMSHEQSFNKLLIITILRANNERVTQTFRLLLTSKIVYLDDKGCIVFQGPRHTY